MSPHQNVMSAHKSQNRERCEDRNDAQKDLQPQTKAVSGPHVACITRRAPSP